MLPLHGGTADSRVRGVDLVTDCEGTVDSLLYLLFGTAWGFRG